MNVANCIFWGLVATIVLTTLLAGSQGLGFTRMNVPFLLGTMVTANRDRAKLYGVGLHLVIGVFFAWIYMVAFQMWQGPTWWKGMVIGAAHAAFLLVCGLPLLPGMHPRMATEQEGPTVVRQLEPPGFLGLHYGRRTPISVFVAHVIFGLILGVFYARAA
jgi:uncharacterized membrane protein YagU involved in acid resistance